MKAQFKKHIHSSQVCYLACQKIVAIDSEALGNIKVFIGIIFCLVSIDTKQLRYWAGYL